MNKVELIGNVGQKEPAFRYTTDGTFQSCSFSMATNERYQDRESKEWKTITDWHRIVVKGKGHATLCEDIHSGTKIFLQGKVKTRKYQGTNGQDAYITEIVVEPNGVIEIIQARRAANSGSPGTQQQSSSVPQGIAGGSPSDDGGGDLEEEQIPF